MAGVPKTIKGDKKRCSAPGHKGPRWLPLAAYQSDSTQPSGLKSHCRDCMNRGQRKRHTRNADKYNTNLRDRRAADPEKDRQRVRDERAKNVDKASAKAEEFLEKERAKARKLAADKERRVSSDFEQLKPDDFDDDESFDTSVANDPKSKGLSQQAAAEKRQEFSRAMGQHTVDLRRAAIADMNGDSELLDAMPAEGGTYIGKLAEQERRFGNRRLARSVSLFSAGEELSRRLWIQACKQYLTGRVVPKGYATKPARKDNKRSVCLLLSDLHLGADLIAAENPMPFRKVEEARRLEYVLRQALDYKPQYRSNSRLKLLIIGDVIEGLLMHDFRDGAPLTEQKVVFQRYMEAFIGECAAAYPGVDVHFQPGNHGRDKVRHPGRATSSKWDSHEAGMYYALMRACSNLKNVTWDLPFRAVGIVDLHGSKLGITHGDTEVKIGEPDTKAKENAQQLAEINSTNLWGVKFDAWAFGHFHKPRYQPKKIRTIFNGALIPPNGHARASGYIGEACGQFLWEAVEGYPVGDVRFIEVGATQDKDERLGQIIEPFRFDLDVDYGFPTK